MVVDQNLQADDRVSDGKKLHITQFSNPFVFSTPKAGKSLGDLHIN